MASAIACFLLLVSAPCAPGQTIWGHALSLDGSNDYVRIADFGQAMPTNEITVEFWLKVDAVKQQAAFSLQPDDAANRFQALAPWTGGPHGTLYWDFGDTTGQGRHTNQLAQAVAGRKSRRPTPRTATPSSLPPTPPGSVGCRSRRAKYALIDAP